MSKASGYAMLLAVALSLIAVSCAGPVIFKPPVAATSTTAAATQGVASTAGGIIPMVPGAATIGEAVVNPTTGPTTDAATQATTDPVVAAAPSPWDGAGVFAAFIGVLLITIWFLNYLFRVKSPENKQT